MRLEETTKLRPEVRYAKGVCAGAKFLLSEIEFYDRKNKGNGCEKTNDFFAETFDVTPVTISYWITELRKAGFIETERTPFKTVARKIYVKD